MLGLCWGLRFWLLCFYNWCIAIHSIGSIISNIAIISSSWSYFRFSDRILINLNLLRILQKFLLLLWLWCSHFYFRLCIIINIFEYTQRRRDWSWYWYRFILSWSNYFLILDWEHGFSIAIWVNLGCLHIYRFNWVIWINRILKWVWIGDVVDILIILTIFPLLFRVTSYGRFLFVLTKIHLKWRSLSFLFLFFLFLFICLQGWSL